MYLSRLSVNIVGEMNFLPVCSFFVGGVRGGVRGLPPLTSKTTNHQCTVTVTVNRCVDCQFFDHFKQPSHERFFLSHVWSCGKPRTTTRTESQILRIRADDFSAILPIAGSGMHVKIILYLEKAQVLSSTSLTGICCRYYFQWALDDQLLRQLDRLKCVSVEQSPVLPADPHVAAFLFHQCLVRSAAAR